MFTIRQVENLQKSYVPAPLGLSGSGAMGLSLLMSHDCVSRDSGLDLIFAVAATDCDDFLIYNENASKFNYSLGMQSKKVDQTVAFLNEELMQLTIAIVKVQEDCLASGLVFDCKSLYTFNTTVISGSDCDMQYFVICGMISMKNKTAYGFNLDSDRRYGFGTAEKAKASAVSGRFLCISKLQFRL